jgi:hypothetical protein
MSSEAMKAWVAVSAAQVKAAQLTMPIHDRPSIEAITHTGFMLAWGFVDKRGYADNTLQQIAENSKGAYTADTIGNARAALVRGGLWVCIRRGTQRHGARMVMSTYDPQGLLPDNLTRGLPPCENDPVTRGLTTNHAGIDHEPHGGYPHALSRELITTTVPPEAAAVVVTNDERAAWNIARVADDDPLLHKVCLALKVRDTGQKPGHLKLYAKDAATYWRDDHAGHLADVIVLALTQDTPTQLREGRYNALQRAYHDLQFTKESENT